MREKIHQTKKISRRKYREDLLQNTFGSAKNWQPIMHDRDPWPGHC